jgi:predicted dehydrogenase
MQIYGWNTEGEAKVHVKQFGPYQELLDEADALDLEAVIIAVPLHLHHDVAMAAMQKGLHVLTEKLMGHDVAQCKEMGRTAASSRDAAGNPLILATGHQRHYNILYDNAVDQLRRGLIGPIHHIRAQWHRANMPGNDSWQPPLPCKYMSPEEYVSARRAARPNGTEAQLRSEYKLLEELHSWESILAGTHPNIKPKPADIDKWNAKVAQKRAQLQDIALEGKAEQYGYQAKTLPAGYNRSAMEELIRWRLWDRTGGGLMAELGSHQLDAASIFISSQRKDGRKVKPLSVSGYGYRSLFPEDRECDDHVYCMFEFPGQGYFASEESHDVADPNKKIVVSYSSINGNGFGGWGETVFGTKGTLILEREQDAMLFKGSNTTTRIEVKQTAGGPAMDTYETGGGGAAVAQAAAPKDLSRGYREEIEHWAWCVRNPGNKPRCTPDVALADAVIALTSNLAIADNRRIEFLPEWFDIQSDATPDGSVVSS